MSVFCFQVDEQLPQTLTVRHPNLGTQFTLVSPGGHPVPVGRNGHNHTRNHRHTVFRHRPGPSILRLLQSLDLLHRHLTRSQTNRIHRALTDLLNIRRDAQRHDTHPRIQNAKQLRGQELPTAER